MKYGRLTFTAAINSTDLCNLGDIVQTFAVDLIYRKMKIDKKDIVNISVDELKTYQGEQVLLPIAGYFNYRRKAPAFPTSPDIIPIFLSVYTTSRLYLNKQEFWEKHAPIGCRDEKTMQLMRKKGYDAWLTGCMTMLYPKRDFVPKTPHVFIVDAEPGIFQYIPTELLKAAECITHEAKVDWSCGSEQIVQEMEGKAKRLLERYYNEATLIITSRLHCAAPCVAMGIPTVVVRKGFDERCGWLDKLIHLYTPNEFEQIDWDPSPITIEEHKERLLNMAVSMINREADRSKIKEIHDFYMDRERQKLYTPFMVRSYVWMTQYFPGLAGFIRNKILKPFTIIGKTDQNSRSLKRKN